MATDTQKIIIDIKAETTKATNQIKKLEKQVSSLNKQTKRTNSGFKKTTQSLKGLNTGFKQLGSHLARVAVYYAGFSAITSTIKTFADFEQQIKTLGAVSGTSGEELKALEEKSKNLGETTVFTAGQVAEGMTEMARAGLNYEQQLAGIEDVLNLAVVGQVDLAEATILATGAMNGFGLEATDLGIVVDTMAQGANDSAQTVTQLGHALAKVAPVANDLGFSIQETVGWLEVLADNMIKDAMAGTQLKIALSRLSGNAEAEIWIKKLGIETGKLGLSMYDAQGKIKPFKQQLLELKDAMSGLGDQQRRMYVAKIVGEEAKASVLAMIKDIDKYDGKLKKLQKSYGYAGSTAKEMMDTMQGAWQELSSALNGLAIKIGAELSPILTSIMDDLTEFILGMDDEQIKQFADAIGSAIETLASLGATIGGVLGTIGKFINTLNEMNPLSEKMTLVLAGLVLGFGKLQTALILIGSSFDLLLIKMAKGGVGLKALGKTLLSSQVIWMSVVVAIGLVITKLNDLDRQVKELNGTFGDLKSQTEAFVSVWEDTRGFDATTASMIELKDNLTKLNKEQTKAKKIIDNYTRAINDLKDSSYPLTDIEKDLISGYEHKIDALKRMITTNGLYIAKNKEVGNSVTQLRLKEIALLRKTSTIYADLTDKAEKLTETQIKALTKLNAKLASRKKSLESVLATMTKKETAYTKKMLKLDKELFDKRKENADERMSFEHGFQANIKDLQASMLSDLQQYNDAQKRADEQLALAKEAIAKGEYTQAQTYYDEYMRLIQVKATEEIKIDDDVVRSKNAGISELIKDKRAGHDIELSLLKETQLKEEQAIQAKQLALKIEMLMLKTQMKLQQQQVELIAKLMGKFKDVEWNETFTKFKNEATGAFKELDALSQKQRNINIGTSVDNGGVDKGLDEAKTKADQTKLTPKVEANTTEAEKEFDVYKNKVTGEEFVVEMGADIEPALLEAQGFKKVTEQTRVEATLDLNTTPAQTKADSAKSTIESNTITPKMDLDIAPALASDRRMRQIASRPLPKIVQIIEHHHVQTGNFSTGGVIPRFATGGQLDNGLGHSRKSGSLGGYGGGDKIKALLEAGEFIIRKEAVKALGLNRLYAINQGKLPRFNQGGAVTPKLPRYAVGGSVNSSSNNKTMDINLNIGGASFALQGTESIANQLAEYLQGREF